MKIGFLADIHEDLPGLHKALAIFNKLKCDEIICLGDIAGFSYPHFRHRKKRNASECLRLVKESCSLVIPGNHDLFACKKVPATDFGFDYPANWYSLDFSSRKALAEGKIWVYEDTELEANYSEKDREYLRSLPEFSIRQIDNYNVLFSHHLYPDLTGSSTTLLPDEDLQLAHFGYMKDKTCDLSFFGHNHVEGIWLLRNGEAQLEDNFNAKNRPGPTAIGVPCIANGKNKPGIAVFDSHSGIINSQSLYSFFKRMKKN